MKKYWIRAISLLLCLALILPMFPAEVLALEPAEKLPEMAAVPLSSDLDNTRVIDTAEEFMAIMDDPDGSYRLEADLDLGEVLPLGYDPETGEVTEFTGSLDGNGCTLTYSIRNLPAEAVDGYDEHYGLFAAMHNAEVFSLNLNADLDLVLGGTDEVFAGLLTGKSYGTTFAGIQVDGSICAERTAASSAWACYVGGLVGYAAQYSTQEFVYTVVTACDLDLDVQLRSAGADIVYAGIMDVTTAWCGQVYYTNVTGSVEAYGDGITIKLLDNAEYSTCSQNMDLTATGDIKAVGSEHGIGNAVSGIYTVTGASATASVDLYALEYCDDTSFYGSMTATGTAEWLSLLGASLCDWVQVECPMTVYTPGMEVNVRGIERCNDSSFTGDFDMTGGHVHSSAMENCNRSISYCNMYCEAGGCNLYPLADCYDCYGEGRVEGNCRSGIVSLGAAWGRPISGDRNYYAGDMFMYSDKTEARIIGISGNENMLEGDLITKTNGRSVIKVISGDNNFCAGNVSRTSHGGDMEHGITLQELCQVFDGTNSCFVGTVECMFDFYMGGTSCYMDGAVTVTEYGLTMDLTGENNYFTGSADLYYAGGTVGLFNDSMTAWCLGDFPITVHHNLGGVFNTANLIDRTVYYHNPECGETKHIGYPTYAYDVDTLDPAYSCYSVAVSCERPGNSGTAESAVEGWTNTFDPEEKVVRPEREPATYTLQAVNANGDGVGNVLFYLEGQAYEADENGMVEISGGPGAIAPLVVTVPSEDGEDTILRRINTFYPIPDRLNQIRVSEALEIEFSMAGKEAPSGSFERTGGFAFDLFGREVKLFDLPMEVDLNAGTEAFKINVKYNEDTGLYDATVGTVARKGDLPDKEAVLEALMKKTFPNSIVIRPKQKLKMFGASWTYEALGCFSFEWDGVGSDFTMRDSLLMMKLSGEARYSAHFPAVPMLYWTAALSGEVSVTGGVKMGPEVVAQSALAQLFATVEPTIRFETGLGVGSRYVDVYIEGGGGGQLNGSMDLPLGDIQEDLSLVGSVDLYGEVRALIWGGRISKKFLEVQLWPVKDDAATSLLTAEDMKILPRTYASAVQHEADAGLTSSGTQARQFASTPGDEENDYPYTDVQMWALSGDRYLLVYTDDDLTRESADRSTLRAAIGTLTDGTLVWGESVTLDPDGTADLAFDVCVSNDKAAVVWQDLNTTFGDGADAGFETVASAVELNTMRLDCTGDVPQVGEITELSTGTDVYEYMPRIWFDGYYDDMRLSWVTSTVNDPLYDGDETYTLWLSDGGDPTAVADTQSPIMAISLTDFQLLWSEQAEEDGSLWQMDSDGTITQLLESGVSNLQSRGDHACYTYNGVLYERADYYSDFQALDVALDESNSIRLSGDGNIWVGVAGLEESVIYRLESEVLRPVFRHEGFLSSWDADGTCVTALTKTGFDEDDTARLVSTQQQTLEALTLGEIECDDPMAASGSTMRLSIPVHNDGTYSFSTVDVQVLAQDGTALYSNPQWSAYADAGETVTVNLQFTLPADFAPQTLTVSINGVTKTIAVGGSNLAVEGQWDIYDADSVSIFLRNTGSVADTGKLTLWQDGQAIWTTEATVAAGEMAAFLVPLGKYYDAPADVTVTLEESAAGLYMADNEDTIYIRPDYARSLVVTVPALTEGEQGIIGVRAWPEGSFMPGVTYASADPAVATISDDGVITAVVAGETEIIVTTDQGRRFTTTLTVNAAHVHSFTNYISDNNATCTEDGTKTATCDSCQVTDTIPDEGSAPGHSWDEGVVTVEPTDDTNGEIRYTCTVCGETRTETIVVLLPEAGFYAAAQMSLETCIQEFYYHQVNLDQNVFYFGFQSDYWTLESVEPVLGYLGIPGHDADDVFTLEQVGDGIYQITLTPWAVSTGHDFEVGLNLYLTDPEGNSNNGEWYTGIWCHRGSEGDAQEAQFYINGQEYKFFRGDENETVAFRGRHSGEYNENGDEVWVLEAADLPDGFGYDLDTNTITLNNASLERLELGAHWVDQSSGDEGWNLPNENLTIKLTGENTISCGWQSALNLCDGVHATITGDGSLAIRSENSLQTDENGNYVNYNAINMWSDASLTIAGDAAVTVEITGEAMESCWDGDTLLGTRPAQVAAIEGGMGSLTLVDNASLTTIVPEGSRMNGPKLENEEQVFWDDWYPGGYRGIRSMYTITIEGGILNTQEIDIPSQWDENGFVSAGAFIQSGGTVNIIARGSWGETEQWVWDDEAQENVFVGMIDHYHYQGLSNYEGGTVEITGGELNINCLQTEEELASSAWGDGIKLGDAGEMTLSGGTVNVQINRGNAVTVNSLAASGGSLTAAVGEGSTIEADTAAFTGNARLILNGADLTMSGTLRVDDAASVAIQNAGFQVHDGGVLTLDGGELTVDSTWIDDGMNDWPNAAYVHRGGEVIVNDGKLVMDLTGYRMGLAIDGNLTQNGGEITIAAAYDNAGYFHHEDEDYVELRNAFAMNGKGCTTINGGVLNLEGFSGYEHGFDPGDPNNPDWPANRNTKLTVNGGTINITAAFAGFDLSAPTEFNGGSINVNTSGAYHPLSERWFGYGLLVWNNGSDEADVSGALTINGGTFDLQCTRGEEYSTTGICFDHAPLTIDGSTLRIGAAFGLWGICAEPAAMADGLNLISLTSADGKDLLTRSVEERYTDEDGMEVVQQYFFTSVEEDNTPGDFFTGEGMDECTDLLITPSTCGETTWDIDNGELIISGDGAMDDYASGTQTPWNSLRDKITSVTVEAGVAAIGDYAFAGCSALSEITFLGDVPTIGGSAFLGVTATASYDRTCSGWTAEVLRNYGGTITWKATGPVEVIASGWSGYTTWSLTDDGTLTFSGEGAMKNYTYKTEMPWYSYFDQITRVVLEEGVTAIGSYAFYGMPQLASIEIPETVTSIGDYAFKNCPKLDDVVLPGGLTSLGDSAFYACTSLTSIEIPASLWTVKPYTFKNCAALESVTFHEGNLQKISDGAFYGTALKEVTFPDCLDILDVYTFKNCADLETITLGTGLTEIREAVFYGTAIPDIVIPEGIRKIGPYAFKNCVNLRDVTLPESLTSVGEASFYACTALESLVLPDAVTAIGNYAFRRCTAMETVQFSDSLVTIGESSFYGCTGLTELLIPDEVTTIGAYAFKGCTGVTAITLGDSVEALGDSAFHTCIGLKTIVLPERVKSIGEYCFSGSYNLWQLTFRGDAPTIGTGAFKGLVATASYPGGNPTWTSAVMLNYGGKITWKAI